jgi:ABC-type branched-subunit amino acid transport system permease subunit
MVTLGFGEIIRVIAPTSALLRGQPGIGSIPSYCNLFFSVLLLAGVAMGGAGKILGVTLGWALIAYLPERFRGVRAPHLLGGQDLYLLRLGRR